MSELVRYVEGRGGLCTRAELLAVAPRSAVDATLASGDLVWLSRGRYAVPTIGRDVAIAHGLRGVLSHTSAAQWHGWELTRPPDATHVTIPRGRRRRSSHGVHLHRCDLGALETIGGLATTERRTLVDCLRTLPFDEALTVADSALRHGVGIDLLREVARSARGPGAPGIRRAAVAASGLAANPFESCLRAIALDVPGLDVRPQVPIVSSLGIVRPDLVDERLRIVIEADSFEWHGHRDQLVRDARRYNSLIVDDWLVLRFSYEEVMFRPYDVRGVLLAATDTRTQVLLRRTGAA